MAPQDFTHLASLMTRLLQSSNVAPKTKKNLADITTLPLISLCSLGRAIHEYEDIQQ